MGVVVSVLTNWPRSQKPGCIVFAFELPEGMDCTEAKRALYRGEPIEGSRLNLSSLGYPPASLDLPADPDGEPVRLVSREIPWLLHRDHVQSLRDWRGSRIARMEPAPSP